RDVTPAKPSETAPKAEAPAEEQTTGPTKAITAGPDGESMRGNALKTASNTELAETGATDPAKAKTGDVIRRISGGEHPETMGPEDLDAIGGMPKPLKNRKPGDPVPLVYLDGGGQPVISDTGKQWVKDNFPATHALLEHNEQSTSAGIPADPQSGAEIENPASSYPQPNKHGVYSEKDAEPLTYKGKKSKANINVLQTEDGWIAGSSHNTSNGGASTPLTKRRVYSTREEAINGAAADIITQAGSIIDSPSSTAAEKAEAKNIIEWAKAQGGETKPSKQKVPRGTPDKPQESGVSNSQQSHSTPSGALAEWGKENLPKIDSKNHAAATVIAKRLKLAIEALKPHEGAFSSIEIGPAESPSGITVFPKTGLLRINPENLLYTIGKAGSVAEARDYLNGAFDEEFRHVAIGLAEKNPEVLKLAKETWAQVPDGLKKHSAGIYFNRTGAKFKSDEQARQEFQRQLWQNADFRKLTEAWMKKAGQSNTLRKMIAAFLKELRKIVKGINAKLKPAFDRLIAEWEAAGKELGGELGGEDATNPEPAKAETSTPTPEAKPSANTELLNRKASELEALADKMEAGGNADGAARQRAKAQGLRSKADTSTAMTEDTELADLRAQIEKVLIETREFHLDDAKSYAVALGNDKKALRGFLADNTPEALAALEAASTPAEVSNDTKPTQTTPTTNENQQTTPSTPT
ncbi:MAG: hypothetical protein WCL08_11565, partial [Verrucomicrobiota bacterium]